MAAGQVRRHLLLADRVACQPGHQSASVGRLNNALVLGSPVILPTDDSLAFAWNIQVVDRLRRKIADWNVADLHKILSDTKLTPEVLWARKGSM